MPDRTLTTSQIVLIAGTRVALGAGLGLLIAGKLDRSARKAAGWMLVAIGALTTFPIVADVLIRKQTSEKQPIAENRAA